MDNVHTFGDQSYQSADEIEKLGIFKQFTNTLDLLVTLLPNLLVVIGLTAISIARHLYHLVIPKNQTNIRGQLAVVSGGSNGIGREICLELAKDGCNIAVLDVDFKGAENTCQDIRMLGAKAMPYKVDVGKYEEVANVKKRIVEELGAVDILVNNAGLLPKVSLREGQPEDIERIINVNITSHFWMIRVFIEDMIARRKGHIVAIASMIAFYPAGGAIAYGTTKYAVKGLMESLNQEIRHEKLGIKTLTVFPHIINSRKELMDFLRNSLGMDALERVGIRSPKDVAVATVNAIKNNNRYISIPWYYLGLGKLFQSLPANIQRIFTDVVMPKMARNGNVPLSQDINGHNIDKYYKNNMQ